jgi:hypothetical protein
VDEKYEKLGTNGTLTGRYPTFPGQRPEIRFLLKKLGTDGTFTNFHSSKNWRTFRLSPFPPVCPRSPPVFPQSAKERGTHYVGNARKIKSLGRPPGECGSFSDSCRAEFSMRRGRDRISRCLTAPRKSLQLMAEKGISHDD